MEKELQNTLTENQHSKVFSNILLNNQQKIMQIQNFQNQCFSEENPQQLVYQGKKERKKNNLSKQQILLIANLYSLHRSKWSLYTIQMKERNEREIKNFFYNSLRKLATKLSNIEKKKRLFQKNDLDTNMLRNLIDISIIVKRTLSKFCKFDYDLLIYKVKEQIFQICFKNAQYDQQKLLKLSKDIRKLKFLFKNLKNIEKSLVNETESKRFALTVIQKQLSGDGNAPLRAQLKQQLNLVEQTEEDQQKITIGKDINFDKRERFSSTQIIQHFFKGSCCCDQCVQFYNFQQCQYFLAMQQLHQVEQMAEAANNLNNLESLSSKQSNSFYPSNFNPYMPAICKTERSL